MKTTAASALLGLCLLATSLAVPAEAATGSLAVTPRPVTPRTAIAWTQCTDAALAQAGAECGTLQVPLDYSQPNGTKITLALSRVEHTSPDSAYQGVLLTAPNPLGGAGYESSLIGARLPDGAGASYDWIGFARRGLAPSVPALSCQPDYMDYDRPDYVPASAADQQVWLDRASGYADACAANNPGLLTHMKTTDTVADMERIRIALGVPRLTLYGQSYGTYIGQVYSTLHPERVRRMVLDSNVDPRRTWYDANSFDQAVPLERNLHVWFDWLARHDAAYHLGTTEAAVAAEWDRQLAAVRVQPAGGLIGPDEWIDVFLVASYFQQSWTLLGQAFAGWVQQGDAATLAGLFAYFSQRGNDNTYATLLAEICTDGPYPADWSQWTADSEAENSLAPDTTWGNTWFNAPCRFWPAPAGQPVIVNGSHVASALLVDQTLDAATPYEGSLEVRARYPGSALVAVNGGTDNGATPDGNPCVDNAIAAYLTDGALPVRLPGRQADRTCSPLPEPEPVPAT